MTLSPLWDVTYRYDGGRCDSSGMRTWKDFISKPLRKHHLFV